MTSTSPLAAHSPGPSRVSPYQPLSPPTYVKSLTTPGTVEYAYNDFCISELALALGNTADYEKYSARSSNWKNMFNANTASDGYVGFLEPRYLNGSFGFQDPVVCSGLWNLSVSNCYLNANGQE